MTNEGRKARHPAGTHSLTPSRVSSDTCRKHYWRWTHQEAETIGRDHDDDRHCEFIGCNRVLPKTARPQTRFCSDACRQAHFRERRSAG